MPVATDGSAPVLSVFMAQAGTYGNRIEGSNPCRDITRYRRKGRERFLPEEEVRRLGWDLKQYEDDHRMPVAIVRILMLAGCRQKETVTLR